MYIFRVRFHVWSPTWCRFFIAFPFLTSFIVFESVSAFPITMGVSFFGSQTLTISSFLNSSSSVIPGAITSAPFIRCFTAPSSTVVLGIRSFVFSFISSSVGMYVFSYLMNAGISLSSKTSMSFSLTAVISSHSLISWVDFG